MTTYILHKIDLTKSQLNKYYKAVKNKSSVSFNLQPNQFRGNIPVMLTQRQINKMNKGKSFRLELSENQIKEYTSQHGGSIGALAGLASLIPVFAPLAIQAVKSLTEKKTKKGDGVFKIPRP